MAQEKVLHTRIQLKYDTYEEWFTKNPVLKSGEVAIATVSTVENENRKAGLQNTPNLMIKVGDGSSHYQDLKFVSGLAADVYGWAKESNKPSYNADEIGELDTYVKTHQNNTVDTNTIYQITGSGDSFKLQKQEKGSEVWNDVSDIIIPNAAVAKLEKLVGKTEVATQIANAINALNLSETYATKVEAQGYANAKDASIAEAKKAGTDAANALDAYKEVNDPKVTANTSAITKLTGGAEIVGSVAHAVAEEAKIARAAEKANQGAAAAANSAAVAAQGTADTAVKNAATAQSKANTADEHAVDAQTRVGKIEKDYLKKADKTELTDADAAQVRRIAALEGKIDGVTGAMHFVGAGELSARPSTGKDGDVYAVTGQGKSAGKEFVYSGGSWVELGDTTAEAKAIENNKTAISEIDGKLKTYGDIVTHNVSEFATSAQGKKADSALQEITTTPNGGLKVSNKNGIDIDDSIVFVFDCGSATIA